MADLWKTLGYDEIALEISEALARSDDIQVVKGPPGVGKSWLAKGIGALWESAGGGAVVAEGDPTRSDLALYPFGLAMSGIDRESLGPTLLGYARAAEVLLGTAGLLTTSIEAVARLQAQRQGKRTALLERQERDILIEMAKLGKRRPLLVIADNLHWWDSTSLEFLTRLRDARLAEAFPFLRKMRVLAVETTPHQQIAHPSAHDALLRPRSTHVVELSQIGREGFEEVLVALGAGEWPSAEAADLIHKFSGGHLALAHRCAMRINEDEAESFLSASDPDAFVRNLLGERVETLGATGEEAVGVLKVAAVSGLTFRRDALACATNADKGETSRLLRYCCDEEVLELRNGTGRFVHDFYRQYFLDVAGEERAAIHNVLGDCMRKLAPGDYESRCLNALQAGDLGSAAGLAVQASLQRRRDGLSREDMPPVIWRAIEEGELTEVAEQLHTAWDHLALYQSDACLRALASLPHQLPLCLIAETAYIRSICLMTTRSERDRRDAQVILESWSSYIDEEPEIGLRLMRLRLYHLSLQVEKEPALRLEAELRRMLHERQSYDKAAEDALYTLDRLAGATQRADRALAMIERAAAYFAPAEDEAVLRRPVEYYLSLLNLGAHLIAHGQCEAAIETHTKLDQLIGIYGAEVFPRVDYPRTNALLARYRVDAVTLEEAVESQRQIVVDHLVPGDPFFVENALAVYLALAGSYQEAIQILDRIAAQLADRGDPEPSLVYLIHGNRCAARFLSGSDERTVREWEDLGKVAAEIPYETRPEMLRRHKLLGEAMIRQPDVTAHEFDSALLCDLGFDAELSRGFWLPAIEWWR